MKLGYTLLYVDDVEKAMTFYSKAFGFEVGFLHNSKQYGEMATGDTKLGFVHNDTASSHGFEYEGVSLDMKPPGFEIGLVTEEVDAAFNRAVEVGAVSVCKPTKKPWGQVISYVRDCNGFLVEICSPMG